LPGKQKIKVFIMPKGSQRSLATGKDSSRSADNSMPAVYPFTAIVGQEEMKLSLVLNVIDPAIGGVMIMGDRGTGKSTAVRALAGLLPPILKVKGCLYGCDPVALDQLCADCRTLRARARKLPGIESSVPVVDLPLGATEDRVCGTLDIERALTSGIKAFEPGLLARAHRGFLYIDEVNLLEDHLVDLLLDTAASGRNVVEREGISVSHPARFVLVGSGNPEEGELRPQLLDRFGFHAQIATITDLDLRVQIVELRERFDLDARVFQTQFEPAQMELRARILQARQLIKQVEIGRDLLRRVAELCLLLKIEGHRGELTIARAARALAALEARATVTALDVRRIATLSLRHRLRKDPLEAIDSGLRVQQAVEKLFPQSAETSVATVRL
jgi:magnesium chelatase subunit I